ncbi:MAG: PAS domain-containing protein [Acidimicrobiales bacterium]|nr:PAS domain-containing protein [Acidimicrobiales bacterium]
MAETRGNSKLVIGVLAFAAALAAVYPSAPAGLGQAVIYDGLALLAAGVALYGAHIRPPEDRVPWQLLAAACGLFLLGDIIWDIYEISWNRESPVPSYADVAFIGGYLCLLASGVALRRRSRRADLGGPLLDAGIVASAMAILCWEPLLLQVGGSPFQAFVAGIYPVGDVAVLALIVTMMFGRRSTWTGNLMIGGLLILTFADLSFLFLSRSGSYATGDWPDVLFMLGPVVLASAAVAPDHQALMQDTPLRYGRLASVALACVALVAVPFGFLQGDELTTGDRIARVALRVVFLSFVAGRLMRLAITEERAQDRLGATSTRLASVVEHASVAVIYTTPDGIVHEWNAAAEHLFGFPRDVMIGGNLLDRLAIRDRTTLWRGAGSVAQDVLPFDLPTGRSLVALRREAMRRSGVVVGYTVFASDATKDVLAEASTVTETLDEIAPVVERLGAVLHEVVPFDVLGLYAVADDAYRELVTVTVDDDRLRAHLDLRAVRTPFDEPMKLRLRHLNVGSLQDTAIDDPLAWFVRDASAARAAILVALRSESNLHSLFLVGFHEPSRITDEHIGLVEAVAPLLSRAVRRVLIVEHEREAVRRLEEIDGLRRQLAEQLSATGMRAATPD